MTAIADRKLAALYKSLETARQTDPAVKIGDQEVVKILAQVGDSSGNNAAKVLTKLTAPNLTRAQQVEIVKRGMSVSEKKDLSNILDAGTVPLTDPARNFIEAVLDRAPVTPGGPLKVSANGFTGTLKAGDTLEAINISAAPNGRLHMTDTMEIGKADAQGRVSIPLSKLSGDQAVKEGDLIRLQARHADGTADGFITVRATGIAASDTRNAQVALFRVGLTDAGSGKIAVTNINDSRQISEPGAVLQLTNVRTGEKTTATIDDTGNFPAGFKVNGKAGDSFSVAATDGTNNTGFTTEVGRLTVPGGTPGTVDLIKDPALHHDELNADGTPKYVTKKFNGPLFKDGVAVTDTAQGQLGDCYFPSAISAIAVANPEALQNMIKDNGDGTYDVTFKKKDWATDTYKDVTVKVDGDLYVRSFGGPLYGSSTGDKSERSMEMWFPLIEKGYATLKGSYEAIGNGGLSNDVMEAVLGREAFNMNVSERTNPDTVWSTITTRADQQAAGLGGHLRRRSRSALHQHRRVRRSLVLGVGHQRERRREVRHRAQPLGRERACGQRGQRRHLRREAERLYEALLVGHVHQVMALPPEPLEQVLPNAIWVLDAEVIEIVAQGEAAEVVDAPRGATSTGQKAGSQKVKLLVKKVLKGDPVREVTVVKPEAGYALKVGNAGLFLIDAGKTILGRYGPDSYAREKIETAIKQKFRAF